jgi:LysR family hydrogen peroxide-inducible transcriptional activator
MTLVELRFVVALAEEQHFGRAAAFCGVSQPALSTAIRKLEKELDVILFERSRSGVHVTPIGRQIASQAQRLMASIDTIKAIADAGSDQLKSPLSVGALATIGPYLLPQSIPHLRERAPAMELCVQEDDTDSLSRKLRDGYLDAIVVAGPFAEIDVVTRELFEEPLVLLLPHQHPLAASTSVDPRKLDPESLLLLDERYGLNEQVREIYPQLQGVPGNGSSIQMLRNMVANDLGITVLPLSVAVNLCSGSSMLVTRPFAGSAPTRRLLLAWRASFPRHKAMDVLCQALQSTSAAHGFYTTERELPGQGLLVQNSDW